MGPVFNPSGMALAQRMLWIGLLLGIVPENWAITSQFRCPPDEWREQAAMVPIEASPGKFLPVYASKPPGQKVKARNVIIALHGAPREGALYFGDMLKTVSGNGQRQSTLVVAPNAPHKSCTAQQWLGSSKAPRSTAPVWGGSVSSWAFGWFADGTNISFAAALDSIFPWLSSQYEGIEKITVTGNSAGSQCISRWSVLTDQGVDGKTLDGIPLTWIISAPSTLLYLTKERPAQSCIPDRNTGASHTCAKFEEPKQGDPSPPYCDGKTEFEYGMGTEGIGSRRRTLKKQIAEYLEHDTDLDIAEIKEVPAALKERYGTKDLKFLVGRDDMTSCTVDICTNSCAANAQGRNRLQRVLNYVSYLNFLYPGKDVPYEVFNGGHYHLAAWSSGSFSQWAFIQPTHLEFAKTSRVVADEGWSVEDHTNSQYSPHQCETLCLGKFRCRSFAYNPDLGQCHLKDKCVTNSTKLVPANAGNSKYVTYFMPCGTFERTPSLVKDEGNELDAFGVSGHWISADECKERCDKNPECNSVSYGQGLCFLKDKCQTAESEVTGRQDFITYYRTQCRSEAGKEGLDLGDLLDGKFKQSDVVQILDEKAALIRSSVPSNPPLGVGETGVIEEATAMRGLMLYKVKGYWYSEAALGNEGDADGPSHKPAVQPTGQQPVPPDCKDAVYQTACPSTSTSKCFTDAQQAAKNGCPPGSRMINSPGACKEAAEALGFTFKDVETSSRWPSGCYRYWGYKSTPSANRKGVYFNLDNSTHLPPQEGIVVTPVCQDCPEASRLYLLRPDAPSAAVSVASSGDIGSRIAFSVIVVSVLGVLSLSGVAMVARRKWPWATTATTAGEGLDELLSGQASD
eukprot:TRINITY_DN28867_c0_g1_i1.p1 TRINITY_DN28867_c0_g1~~TRINITY_DN28867_c0_g1_i1.p1  ORF type:complete len:853 (-),score=91.13 TRINITY_DN28867_c0_g1_i1:44-2602(-)